MSTAPTPAAPVKQEPKEIRIISHSSLFYWWPVWAIGFIYGLIVTPLSGQRLAIVPDKTELHKPVKTTVIIQKEKEKTETIDYKDQQILVAPPGKEIAEPKLHISGSKNIGILFLTILLLVIIITNVPLRGLWSVMIIGTIVFLSIIFAYMGVWEYILAGLGFLDVRINQGGYLFFSTILFIIWLVVFLFFDKQIYIIFTPGLMRVRLEIGEGETAYPTIGMTTQKQRSDLFRHWILGLGSGDLIVKTFGAQAHQFDLPNVLFLGRRVREIEKMIQPGS